MEREIQLVTRAREGDRDAFDELYGRWSRPVFTHLAAILRTREEAEDALQTSFLKAWRRLPSLRRPERFVPWLFRIARNEARDRRRTRRELPLREGDGEDLIDPRHPDPPEVEAVRRAVAALRPETRSLVLLRCVEEWSAEEIGRALGFSASTVRRKLARALHHLRIALGEGDEG